MYAKQRFKICETKPDIIHRRNRQIDIFLLGDFNTPFTIIDKWTENHKGKDLKTLSPNFT